MVSSILLSSTIGKLNMEKASVPDHEIAELRLSVFHQRIDQVIRFVLTYCPTYSEEVVRIAVTTGKGNGSRQIWSFLGQVLNRDVERLKEQLLAMPEPHEVVDSNYFRDIVQKAFDGGRIEALAQICEKHKIATIKEAMFALMGGKGDKANKIIAQLASTIGLNSAQFREQFRINKCKSKKTKKV